MSAVFINADHVCPKSTECRQRGWHDGCSHATPHDENADCGTAKENEWSCPDCVRLDAVVLVEEEKEMPA